MAPPIEETPAQLLFREIAGDPTSLTLAAMSRAVAAERDYVNGQLDTLRERLRGIDRATELLNESVNRVPIAAVARLRELMDERFKSVSLQFAERDTRSEREARDNKTAVDAAFAAQKEAAAEQNRSNTLAINKSEIALGENIDKLGALFNTSVAALSDKVDDLKERIGHLELRIGGIESVKVGGQEKLTSIYAFVAFLVTIVVIGTVLAANGVFAAK